MTTEYARQYYKEYYIRNKAKYKAYRRQKYQSMKPYYREYYIRNKQKIKDATIKNKFHKNYKNIPTFQKITKKIEVRFD